MVCLWENFIKQKLYIATNLRGGGGGVRFDWVPDLPQLPGCLSKCKEKVCCHGPLADWVNSWHMATVMFWTPDPNPQGPNVPYHNQCHITISLVVLWASLIFCLPDPWLGSQDCREHRMRAPVELLPGKKNRNSLLFNMTTLKNVFQRQWAAPCNSAPLFPA